MTVEELLLACKEPMSVIKLLTVSGLCSSNNEARRKIKEKAIRVQDCLISDIFAVCYLVGFVVVIVQDDGRDINIITRN